MRVALRSEPREVREGSAQIVLAAELGSGATDFADAVEEALGSLERERDAAPLEECIAALESMFGKTRRQLATLEEETPFNFDAMEELWLARDARRLGGLGTSSGVDRISA